MTYHIETYLDAHDTDPESVITAPDLTDALIFVATQAKLMDSETDEYEFGPAGDGELFEVYPTYGVGTVVVKEVN